MCRDQQVPVESRDKLVGSGGCPPQLWFSDHALTAYSMIESVVFNEAGLVPAIAQDCSTGQVLMVAWMNRESLEETVASGRAVYFSRSRQRLWRKGEESGHVQVVQDIRLDCDGDVLLLSVEQIGGIACHTGRQHCFYRQLDETRQWKIVNKVVKDPSSIYGQAHD